MRIQPDPALLERGGEQIWLSSRPSHRRLAHSLAGEFAAYAPPIERIERVRDLAGVIAAERIVLGWIYLRREAHPQPTDGSGN